MKIRPYRAGDEAHQANIYNAATVSLPGFKPATEQEVRRRTQAREFDAGTRFFAEVGSEVVGYATFQQNGRISMPWCLPGHENAAEPLFEAVLGAMRSRGIERVFAAYRSDWTPPAEFLQQRGFQKTRDICSFVQHVMDLPTMVNRRSLSVTPFRPADVPALAAMVPGLVRMSVTDLEAYLLWNPHFAADSIFVLRNADHTLRGVGILIEDPRYADPKQLDPKAPCFRLGAFGSEGISAKRVNGLFSFVAPPGRETNAVGLDLLWYAATVRLENSEIDTFAAQVPSDATHLHAFYQSYFRPQGSFPTFERSLV